MGPPKEKPDSDVSRLGPSGNTSEALLDQYRAARNRVIADVLLLERALDLRELLDMGIDLDDAEQLTAELVRAVKAYKRQRRAA